MSKIVYIVITETISNYCTIFTYNIIFGYYNTDKASQFINLVKMINKNKSDFPNEKFIIPYPYRTIQRN